MRNANWSVASFFSWIATRRVSRTHPRKWILGISLVVALLTWGCPKQDPLQAFNPPVPPNEPGPAPVPEPATALLFGTALLIGGAVARRRHTAHK